MKNIFSILCLLSYLPRLEQVHESRKIGFFLSHQVPAICLTSYNMTFQKFWDFEAQWAQMLRKSCQKLIIMSMYYIHVLYYLLMSCQLYRCFIITRCVTFWTIGSRFFFGGGVPSTAWMDYPKQGGPRQQWKGENQSRKE